MITEDKFLAEFMMTCRKLEIHHPVQIYLDLKLTELDIDSLEMTELLHFLGESFDLFIIPTNGEQLKRMQTIRDIYNIVKEASDGGN